MLAAAIAERDLAGARDAAAVIDARLRHRLGALVPQPAGRWSAQVPALADPGRRAYLAEIAALMDARKDRIGEHAADHAPPWAVNALGPVPGHPLDRLDWQQRASSIGAYRELSGYGDPPTRSAPTPPRPPRICAPPGTRPSPPWDLPTAPTCAACPTGRCCTCVTPTPPETAWAPRYVGDELRQVRAAAWQARLAALRATADARAAAQRGDHHHAERKRGLAASYQALQDAYRQREDVFAAVMADRADWEPPPATSGTWPSPPTPNSAAATPASTTRPCAPPNPSPSPGTSATSSP